MAVVRSGSGRFGQAKAGSVVKWQWFVQVRAGQGRQCGKMAVVRSGSIRFGQAKAGSVVKWRWFDQVRAGSGRPRPAVW